MAVATRNGARAVVDALAERAVEYLFGVPGHGAYPIYGALTEVPAIQPIVGRNEQGVGFVADGWAWVTNRVAVATCVPEAGLTNSSTCLLQATQDSERVLYIVEEHPSHQNLLRSVTRYLNHVESATELRPRIQHVLDRLEIDRPAGAALEVPAAILAGPAEDSGPVPDRPARRMPEARALEEAAALLSRAERPAIVAGRPVVAAGAEATLLRLAERLRAPVFAHPNAKGVVSEDHPLALGFTWSPTTLGEELLASADVVLAIGPRAGVATGPRPAARLQQQLIHLDWDDAEQRAGEPARLALAGHVGDVLEALVDGVRDRTSDAFPAELLERVRHGPWEYADRRIPWAVSFFRELQSALPRDALFFTDSLVGLWIFRLLRAFHPRSFRFGWGNGSGTLGYALPGAIGAKLADPSREAIVIAGDGAFLYNPQELATMLRYRQKLTVIVCNDDCFGAVRDNLAEQYGTPIGHELANPDFVRLAESFDMRGVRLTAPDEIGPALRSALAGDRSTLIEVPLELRPGRF